MKNKMPTLPGPVEFFLEIPIYKPFSFDTDKFEEIIYLEHFKGSIDCYCLDCKKESVFYAEPKVDDTKYKELFYAVNRQQIINNHIFIVEFFCVRNINHKIYYIFEIKDSYIMKIGQNPSMADLAKQDIQKYRKILSADLFAEFNRSVGLVAHGVGIGSFVYLRRIFETLISEAYDKVKIEPGWDEDQYQRSRMEERIILLKSHLPSFLVENRALYSILSKGVHELTEQECLGAFPIVKMGIEMILDEKISEQERQAKEAEARKAIGKLAGELKGS